MSVTVSQKVEMYLSGSWVDVSSDVIGTTHIQRGVMDSDPIQRVASTGTCLFLLNNSEKNSAGKIGYYSPAHANARTGFDIGTLVRVTYTSGGTSQVKFYGRIAEIDPDIGIAGERSVQVTATDYMDILATRKIPALDVQIDKTPDALINTIVAALDTTPLATDYSADSITFPYSLDKERVEATTALTALQRVCKSSRGYLYVRPTTTSAETLVYQTHNDRIPSVSETIDNIMTAATVRRALDNIYNRVKFIITPRTIDTSAVVLAQYNRTIELEAGEEKTITMYYRDPTGAGRRVSGIDMQTPVAGTDYKFGSSDGADDLNSDLGVTVDFGGNSAEVTLKNNASSKGYVTGLQLQGKGVYTYDPVEIRKEDAASVAAYGLRELVYDNPYLTSDTMAESLAATMLNYYADPVEILEGVEIVANRNAAEASAVLSIDIGDGVKILESVSGVDNIYFVNGVEYNYENGILRATWHVTLSDVSPDVFILDSATNGILDTNTLGA